MIRGAAHKVAHLKTIDGVHYELFAQNAIEREHVLDLDTVCRGCVARVNARLCEALNRPKASPCVTAADRLAWQIAPANEWNDNGTRVPPHHTTINHPRNPA